MNRFIVLFDASPINEPTAWMKQTCAQADLHLVLQDDIARTMSEDPTARAALLESNTVGPDPRMAPHYQAALDKLAQGKTRIGLHSATWTAYGLKPDALVYSFDQMQNERQKALKMGMKDADYDFFVKEAKAKVSVFFKGVPPERLLEVSGPDAQKVQKAVAFIRARPAR